MTGNNNVHKTLWKNGKKEYEKYICCFFTIRNLKSAITYKCGRVVPFLISVYFAMSKPYCYFNILFMHHALYFPTFIFTLYVPSFSFFLIDRNQKQVLLINESSVFWSSKIFICSFQLFENCHIHKIVSTLINVMKFDVENNSIVSTLSNIVNINVEINSVDLMLLKVVSFNNVDIHNLVLTLNWHFLTSWRHITLTVTLRRR